MSKRYYLTNAEIEKIILQTYVPESVHWFMKYFKKGNKFTEKTLRETLRENKDIFIKKNLDFSDYSDNTLKNMEVFKDIFRTLRLMDFDFDKRQQLEFIISIKNIKQKSGVSNKGMELWLTNIVENSKTVEDILEKIKR